MNAELLKKFMTYFETHANSNRAQAQQAYMKSALPFFGLTKPEVTLIARQYAKEHTPGNQQEYGATILYLIEQATHRELWYAAVEYARYNKQFICKESIPCYIDVIRKTQWWDIVDTVADHLIGKALHTTPHSDVFLKTWVHDANKWVRRTAIIAQLKYKEKTNLDILAYCITQTMHEKDFFIRKAIGWALRSYAYTDSIWVQHFVEKHKNSMSGLSKREALKRCGQYE